MPAKPDAMPVANGLIGRSDNPDAGAQQNDGDSGQRVVSRGNHHGDDERIKRERFFGHTIGGTTKGKNDHQYRDQQILTAPKCFHDAGDSGIDRAGFHRDAEKTTDDDERTSRRRQLRRARQN